MKQILFIHGFSAKKEDNEYFLNQMNKKLDVEVHTFVLPGHSEKKVDRVSYTEWLEKSEEELLYLMNKSDNVYLVAHSMGAVIATYLAAKHKGIKKLVLISPAFEVGNFDQNKEDLKNLLKGKIDKDLGTGFEGVLKKVFTIPAKEYEEVIKIGKIGLQEISKIECPVLILHGTKDNVVPLVSSINAYGLVRSKKHFTLITNVRHQVFKSSKKEIIADYIYDYIKGGFRWKMHRKENI